VKGRTAGEPAQFRGLLPEKVIISMRLDPYLPLRALAAYSGLSVRTLRSFIERDLPRRSRATASPPASCSCGAASSTPGSLRTGARGVPASPPQRGTLGWYEHFPRVAGSRSASSLSANRGHGDPGGSLPNLRRRAMGATYRKRRKAYLITVRS